MEHFCSCSAALRYVTTSLKNLNLTAPRVILGGVPVLATFYMTLSIKAARQRDIPAHTEYAMRCFLYSIEGAGTIRQG